MEEDIDGVPMIVNNLLSLFPFLQSSGRCLAIVIVTIVAPVSMLAAYLYVPGPMILRISSADMEGKWINCRQPSISIARNQGWRQLFAGLSINYIKVVPSAAIGFTTYDIMKSWLKISTEQYQVDNLSEQQF